MKELIKATNITKSYGDLQVLRGIGVSVNTGEVLSIVGASGAGKSTLLHILGTLDVPDNGTLAFESKRIDQLNRSQLSAFRNSAVGFVFQFHNLLPEFTAFENVCLPGFIGNKNTEEVKQRAAELLGTLGLSARIDHKPSELSGGEQQRVAVARALINKPKVVFADEPSGNLDSKNADELHELFFKLRDELGQTFVIVTHNKELAEMSDRQVILKDGLIVSSL
ncbi:ABC transporter ATP-binding protein [Roseivirga pacifica]